MSRSTCAKRGKVVRLWKPATSRAARTSPIGALYGVGAPTEGDMALLFLRGVEGRYEQNSWISIYFDFAYKKWAMTRLVEVSGEVTELENDRDQLLHLRVA